jgi:O-antigen biosynthesis protein
MDLSVIIVNYNVRYFLEQCLNSVRKAAENIDCEIFVVDNNSADGSCSMVISQYPEVKLIRNLINTGFSKANNQAITISKGRYVLLLNPDTIVEEDTFIRCIAFMDTHNDAGSLGVKMINGHGKLLPESKRAIPTPGTALFKMAGLSFLFPKSEVFNRYYLGHLDSSVTSEAEIISGAFMFIRKEALNKTGLLDETFFMYGEDIDLSYRILKEGYKNYYFPDVKIIHYKGASTKKGDINYVVMFYKAMLIFVKKHLKGKGNGGFIFIISLAVYFWGFIAIGRKLLRNIILPAGDALLLAGIYSLIIHYWENYKFRGDYYYPGFFITPTIVSYIALTLLTIYLAKGYKLPARIVETLRGIVFSSVLIILIYSMLPLEFRFSRAVIILGALSALTVIPLYRYFLSLLGSGLVINPFSSTRRTVVVGGEEELKNIRILLMKTDDKFNILGRVSVKQDDLGPTVLGNIQQILEVIRINKVHEVIFSTRELSASQIINSMHLLSSSKVNFKISPIGEKLIIGSKSVNHGKPVFSLKGIFLKQEQTEYLKDSSDNF